MARPRFSPGKGLVLLGTSILLMFVAGCPRFHPTSGVTHKVTIGPDSCTLNPPGDVTLGQLDQIEWKPSTAGTSILIVFEKKSFPPGVTEPPFEHMTTNSNGDYVSTNPSGAINPKLGQPPADGFLYKYDQTLGTLPQCDGRIIIKW
jgi:hypothetical protein